MLTRNKYFLLILALLGCAGGCTTPKTTRDMQKMQAQLNSTREVMKVEFDLLMKLSDDVKKLQHEEYARSLHGQQ
jgi:hypothetical protein